MSAFLIRNDDVNFDTELGSLQRFCEICDRYGFKIMQAITPLGECRKVNAKMSNAEIIKSSNRQLIENTEVYDYLKSRDDLIGVHGFMHTHAPDELEVAFGRDYLRRWGFEPTYFVPPFNEGEYPDEVASLKTCQLYMAKGERLEDFLKEGTPTAPIMYLHSWRFGKWYRWSSLESCLARLCKSQN